MTSSTDPLGPLSVSEAPRQLRIGRVVIEEQLGDRAFRLLKFLADNRGKWYPVSHLAGLLWPDPDTSPSQADQALSRYKRAINDLLRPHLSGQDAIESWPHRGYRLQPFLKATGEPEASGKTEASREAEEHRETAAPTPPETSPSDTIGRSLSPLRAGDQIHAGPRTTGLRIPPIWRSPLFLITFLVLGGGILAWALFPNTRPEPIEITIASSSTKKEWLNQAVAIFNGASKTDSEFQLQGTPIRVDVLLEEIEPGVRDHYRSGTMIRDILARVIEPTAVSPAEQSWILKLKENWPGRLPIATDEGASLVRTPLVVAMWRSRATALGCWPTAGPQCTWGRLRALASSTDGWGMFDHPEWGSLKYGYGYVGRSNSATFTQVLNCMSSQEAMSTLTLDDVGVEKACGRALASLSVSKTSVIRIYEKSEWALRDMRAKGPEYLDAVTTYEEEVIEANAEYSATLAEQIVAVYPQDGTILATHPFTILDKAPWVTPEQVKAAEIFLGFLLSGQQQSQLLRYGFRPADPAATLGPRIDPAYGASPQANLALVTVPHIQVIDAVVKLWEAIRAPK